MKTIHSRFTCLVLLGMLISCACCGAPDSILLLVNVKGLVPDVTLLEANAMLNGNPAMRGYEVSENLSRFAVHLSNSDSSRGSLELQVLGLAGDRCKLAGGQVSVNLEPDKLAYEIDLGLMLLPEKVCTVSVTKPDIGTITSEPAGIDCGEHCTADFPFGTQVKLTARRGTRPIVTDWGVPCTSMTSGVTDTCTISLTQATPVKGTIDNGLCSTSGWCWSNPGPQGNDLWGIWGSDANNVWAIG